MPVVVDTDLAPDDLAALALLLRHPRVRVVAVTVPQTGELDCRGTGLLGDFFDALEHEPRRRSPAAPRHAARTG